MASTISPPILQALSLHRARNAHPPSCKAHGPKSLPASVASRRQLLFLLTAAPVLTVRELASLAEDIPLFGLKKKLKKAEEKAEELVKEGFEAAEKGLETAEKGIATVEREIETAEKGIKTAEREIEEAVSFGGLAQAGAVAGAEVVGVLVATSIVNGILGPEAEGQKS
ncbi:hypothetical protein P3X46_018866 [Hevea brasiliensis]|uniref:Synechocystis YCF37 n=1 Tax=Hevea brasiliensis TaxID=3981 RepID=A0ABQ9LTX6_HEVBR|nr:uncharacterized protein LOC110658094 [Hevea brasiliensis]KAJ9170788.1 hypothetical protein P3X46_018866 [Hevea brasiliensis]